MDAGPRVSEHANIRPLAAQVCLRAIEDLRSPDPVTALDAALWLTGADFPHWAEVASAPFADPFKLLTSGEARTARTKKKEKGPRGPHESAPAEDTP